MKFKVGDKVRYKGCEEDEIVEEFDEQGWIKGRYCDTGFLSAVFADHKYYKLIKAKSKFKKKIKLEKYEEKPMEFKVGDIVRLINNGGMTAEKFAKAIVTNVGKEYINVKWLEGRNGQENGGYYPEIFTDDSNDY